MAEQFKFTVREIVISDLREGIFYARIVCFDGVRETSIDARPSDAVAIGIRFGVPIYTNESVLSEAGITNTPSEEESQEELVRSTNRPSTRSFSDQLKNASSEELQNMLDAALGNEEYERAAKIRDEMSKRN
jgi:bifunctional DNase/RNase